MRKELRHGRGEGKRGGRKRAEEGGSSGRRRGRGAREERGIKGDREGGKLQGTYPEEDTGQYTVYSARNNIQRGPCIATLVLQIQNNCKWVYTLCIVMRRNVLFDWWMT